MVFNPNPFYSHTPSRDDIFSSTYNILTFTNLHEVSLPISPNSWGLPVVLQESLCQLLSAYHRPHTPLALEVKSRKTELENSFILGSSGEAFPATDIRECGTEAVNRNDATEHMVVYFKSLSGKMLWKGSEKTHKRLHSRETVPK
jgi:hypothetical protein